MIRTDLWLKTSDLDVHSRLNLSHLRQYVSAYERSGKMVSQLAEDILAGLKTANETGNPQIVDQDGFDFFFVCHPAGSLDLCMRWKSFTVAEFTVTETPE